MTNLKINVDAQLSDPHNATLAGFRQWLKRNLEQYEMHVKFDDLKDAVKLRHGCTLNGEKEIYALNGREMSKELVTQDGQSGSTLAITENGFEYVEWCDGDYAYRLEYSGDVFYAAYMEANREAGN